MYFDLREGIDYCSQNYFYVSFLLKNDSLDLVSCLLIQLTQCEIITLVL